LAGGQFFAGRTVFDGEIPGSPILKGYTFSSNLIRVYLEDRLIEMPPYVLESIHTQDEFASELITNYDDPDRKRWIADYYVEAVSKQERDIVYRHEKEIIPLYAAFPFHAETWYKFFDPVYTMELELFNHGFVCYRESVWIDKIIRDNNTYTVTALSLKKYTEGWIFEVPQDGNVSFYTLIFEVDGDYIDIYSGDKNTKLATVIGVEPVFLEELYNLIDPARAPTFSRTSHWPRRADGSMDYPPPQLTQVTISEQPVTVTIDTPPAEYEDAAAVTTAGKTVTQQPGIGLPLIVVLVAAGIAVAAGVAVFLIRRKR
jgi:hypothetical protein